MNIKNIILTISLISGVIFTCGGSYAKDSSIEIAGKVRDVSVKVETHRESLIEIHIANRENEHFNIPVKRIMQLPGFHDLRNPRPGTAYGDAEVMLSVHQKLVGKEVVLECVKSPKLENNNTYVIKRISVQ